MLSGMVMLSIPLSAKAYLPILVTLLGISIVLRAVQFEKAELPIDLMPS